MTAAAFYGLFNGSASYASTAGFVSGSVGSAAQAGTASFATSAGTASTSGTAAYAQVSGTASFATASSTASNAGTAAFSNVSGTASFATASSTASTSGTAAYAMVAGTASFATSSTTAANAGTASTAGTAANAAALNGNTFANPGTIGNTTAAVGFMKSLGIVGSTSGTVSVLSPPAAGTYNFVMPITVGAAGNVLTSQGGGTVAMTWTSVLSNPMTLGGQMIIGGAAGAPTALSSGTAGQILTSQGTGAETWTSLPGSFYWNGYYTASSANYWSSTNSGAGYQDFQIVGTIPTVIAIQSANFTVSNAASNLPGVSFTAPRTGIIMVNFIATYIPPQQVSSDSYAFELLESNTTTALAYYGGFAASTITVPDTVPIPLTGFMSITAGTVYNFKLQETSGVHSSSFVGSNGLGSMLAINMEYIN